MKKLIERFFNKRYFVSKETKEKIKLLKSVGVEVSVINKNSKDVDGYMLGKMNDKYSKYRIG
ncbi:hypothetical protein [Clostridium aquiflavi]|uniref:Uncharacterized protein n=1 Tax=Clostridium aquiflavi TaxID=3073603 RepID=A0ABU1EJF4_9CLOT|nr:hypothetical protein [Clostridium sp. 5N-1]MDR5588535.1 hypothetical protein [Clostridium sp. 5N-1]